VRGQASGALGALSKIASTQHGLVTRAQAIGAGAGDHTLRRLTREGGLERVERGVYRFTCVPRSLEQRALGACLARRGVVACGLTAMALYGFDGPSAGRTQVLSRSRRRQPRAGRHVLHCTRRLAAGEVVRRRGVPVTSPARTLADVAGATSADTLERFLGHLLATRELSPAQVERMAAELRGRPAVRRAIERAGMGVTPGSVLEHTALRLIRSAGLPDPAPQWPVVDGGELVGVVDFAWPERLVALEVDGYRWHGDPRTFAGDRRRDNRLRELGWQVHRTTWVELQAGAGELVRQLGLALAHGGVRHAHRSSHAGEQPAGPRAAPPRPAGAATGS
jgi:hypothetical protein